jgi:uncharacterized protein (DUF1501 family)
MPPLSRRSFIRSLLVAEESQRKHDKILVTIFLRGGADTLNMLVPYSDEEYYKTRPTIAIARPGVNKASALRLDGFYGLHPNLSPILPVYREGRLAIVQGVGSDNPSGSHFEAQDQIEHGEAYRKIVGGGWLGRYLQSRTPANSSPLSAVAIGTGLPESLRSAPAATALTSVHDCCLKVQPTAMNPVAEALSQMYSAETGLLGKAGRETLALLAKVEKLRTIDYKPSNGASYPQTDLGDGLREIARLIKADVGLEVATVDMGGWDTHFFQGAAEGIQATNIRELAQALAAFDADLNAYQDKVTTLVFTEFGRRTYENGSQGTDHGRGFALLALGHGIAGGRVHGKWLGLHRQDHDLLGPAGLPVAIDYRSVLSEVLRSCLQANNLAAVFPQFQPVAVGVAPFKNSPQIL